MRDVSYGGDDGGGGGGSFTFIALSVLTAAVIGYSYLMSNPAVLAEMPGIEHLKTKVLSTTMQQIRDEDDAVTPEKPTEGISSADRDALRMLLEAIR